MTAIVLKRLAQSLAVVWASVTLLFAIFYVVPGDRVDQVMGGERVLDQRTHAAVTERLGLDEPVYVQYGKLWANLARGDLGESFVDGDPVVDTLKTAAPASFRLAFWALVVEIVGGVGSAIALTLWRNRFSTAMSVAVSVLLLALPVFVTGYLLQYVFGIAPFKYGWPDWLRMGVQGDGPGTWLGLLPTGEQWRYLVLPALTLGAVSGAVAHRLTVRAIDDATSSAHVRAAAARGISRRRIVVKHVMRNIAGPVIAFVGVDLALLFGSAVVTESVFGWPGVGGEMAAALARADAPVIFGLALVIAIAYVACNLVVDVLHRLVDPRVAGARR